MLDNFSNSQRTQQINENGEKLLRLKARSERKTASTQTGMKNKEKKKKKEERNQMRNELMKVKVAERSTSSSSSLVNKTINNY